jgi:PhnB protein
MKTDTAPIRAAIDSALAALRAKDARGVMTHQLPDTATYSLAPPLLTTETAEGLQHWFDTWRGPIGWELADLEIVADGDVAFAYGLAHMTGTKTDGERPDLWFRQTFGLRRIGGEWKLVHQHHSVPFYMDGSFRAAVDLKP